MKCVNTKTKKHNQANGIQHHLVPKKVGDKQTMESRLQQKRKESQIVIEHLSILCLI